MWQKLKSLLLDDQVFYGFLVVLVGCISFLLGRFSVLETYAVSDRGAIEFLIDSELQKEIAATPVAIEETVVVIASKTGTKYHLPNCPGAKQIKPENQISFPSVAAALAAGYSPASNCPGLK